MPHASTLHLDTVRTRLLLTVEQAAEALGISRATCYRLLQRREIESITVSRLRRIPVAALERFIARQLEEEQSGC